MLIPVVSIARLIPFQEAIIEYFCLAVNGSRGSVCGGGAGVLELLQSKLRFLSEPFGPPPASFDSSQPMIFYFISCVCLWF